MSESQPRPRGGAIEVAGTGFTVLDRIYRRGCRDPREELGGSCGNVLLSLAMLERAVAPVLSLGDDDVGSKLVHAFQSAGAEIAFIDRHPGRRTPVIAELLDEGSSEHSFAFRCPETDEVFATYEPIGRADMDRARHILTSCTVFYADRIAGAIVDAMEAASAAGAVVFFEPSSHSDDTLMSRALAVTDILKFSYDRVSPDSVLSAVRPDTICIATFGSAGLEVRQGIETRWCEADRADVVRDTCGSGDMVSIGVIDWIIHGAASRAVALDIDRILSGIRAGQRLAAANCAFVGARGLFRERGKDYARSILREDR